MWLRNDSDFLLVFCCVEDEKAALLLWKRGWTPIDTFNVSAFNWNKLNNYAINFNFIFHFKTYNRFFINYVIEVCKLELQLNISGLRISKTNFRWYVSILSENFVFGCQTKDKHFFRLSRRRINFLFSKNGQRVELMRVETPPSPAFKLSNFNCWNRKRKKIFFETFIHSWIHLFYSR